MTTNRIKTFDEAFLSRFSIGGLHKFRVIGELFPSFTISLPAIKYPELDHAGRLTVWKKFLELAGCAVSDETSEVEAKDGKPIISPAQLEKVATMAFNGALICYEHQRS